MIIKRLELVNYCQHVQRIVDMSGNLIAVVGHNGCGKSNFLGALQFALTGEQPGKNKADLLHWGAKEGRVILDFEHDGKPGRINRAVGSNKVTLEYDGVTTSGITAVAKEMEERLHMDKDLVRQSVFVRQTEIDTIISAKTDKRDREVAFQKLLGLDAAKIHKNLTDWMYAAEKPLNYDIQITDAVKRLGELETRKAELDGAVAKADADIVAFGVVDDSQSANLSAGIAAITSVLQAQSTVEVCKQASTASEQHLAALEAEVSTGVTGAGENPGVDVMAKTLELSALQEALASSKNYAYAEKAVADTAARLTEAEAMPHPSDEEITQAQAVRDTKAAELAALQGEISVRERAKGSLFGAESTCPVCGKPLDADLFSRLTKELEELNLQAGEAYREQNENTARITKLVKQKTVFDASTEAARHSATLAASNLAALPKPTIDVATLETLIAETSAAIAAQQAYDKAIAAYKEKLSNAKLQRDVAYKALHDAEARLATAEADARKLCGDDAAVDWSQAKAAMESLMAETDKRRAAYTQLQIAKSSAVAAQKEVVTTLETLAASVESLRAAQVEQDIRAKKLSVIERVRDWFSYQNGPRVLVQQVLAVLTDDVNRFLGNFTAPFVVMPDHDQLGFRVQFTDGRDKPIDPPGTDVLSGGERVQLAVAFRLAIYCMFAGKLGLLSLDEPTAYLDDGNVDRFGILLSKVRELAKNMNTQVFMATHERAVIPHMDSVIDLN